MAPATDTPATKRPDDRHPALPIDALRDDFLEALRQVPVVVSAPTGSGKSTQVPRWCPGPVLVVEPRRVACRSLAKRVAELEDSPLGETVGYRVRDEHRANRATRILFATPGVVLRLHEQLIGPKPAFATVVLDELHERSLDVDLILALLAGRYAGHLVAMSATLDAERVARHLGGQHLRGEGRIFPVDIRYQAGSALLPEARGLEQRILEALRNTESCPGDVLVFLPGKGEIASCHRALEQAGWGQRNRLLSLHGGLSLQEQAAAFAAHERRKIVLATNVAETSVTLPGVGVVIDSGLVRRTRYHRGRGFLTLAPVALDSADQRAGRAGRTGPGTALRLWGEAAQLENTTLPEIHRESLQPLILAAAACGHGEVTKLPFLDPPKGHAVELACEELQALGALDSGAELTSIGKELFGLPLDAPLGRWLVEARQAGDANLLPAMIDLVAALAVNRPLPTPRQQRSEPRDAANHEIPTEKELAQACDACHLTKLLRTAAGASEASAALQEARSVRRRLRRAFQLPADTGPGDEDELSLATRKELAITLLAADPRLAHISRRRGRRTAWSNGGTEIELGRDSAANRAEGLEALIVLETRALGLGGRDTRILATRAMPIPVAWLLEANLGRDQLRQPRLERGRVVATVERVYARRVLATREEVPRGDAARRAAARLILEGRLLGDVASLAGERLQATSLALALAGQRPGWSEALAEVSDEAQKDVRKPNPSPQIPGPEPRPLEAWLIRQLELLGLEAGDEVELLSPQDLLPPALPPWLARELDRDFPRQLTLPGATYTIDYDLASRTARLHQQTGRKAQAPPENFLPRLPGFRIVLEHRGRSVTLRKA